MMHLTMVMMMTTLSQTMMMIINNNQGKFKLINDLIYTIIYPKYNTALFERIK